MPIADNAHNFKGKPKWLQSIVLNTNSKFLGYLSVAVSHILQECLKIGIIN